jgi:hypothetical protein
MVQGKNILSHVLHIFQEGIFSFETIPRQQENLFWNSFFQILFVLLESTHFKAPDGSENG